MKIAVNIGPTGDWSAMLAAARAAESYGFDAVGTLDHYHAEQLEWSFISGWSAYGALAMATSRIKLTPMVIDHMNYLPGVIAKETATLSWVSNGRFELGIGAGDYFEEARAWGTPVPDASTRVSMLQETITALRMIWQGERVNFDGQHLHLKNAASTPIPIAMPRVVVGAGSSRRLIRSALTYADEINVYGDDELIRFALDEIAAAQRPIALSAFVWDWPEKIEEKLANWRQLGVQRTFLTFWPPFDGIPQAVRFMS